MAFDFEAVIQDERNYPDNLEFDFGGQKVPLGAIRERSKKEQQRIVEALATMEKQREAERQALEQRQRQVADMADKATAMHTELQRQLTEQQQQTQQTQRAKEAQANGGFDPEAEYENGVWYAPMRKRYSAHDTAIKKLSDDFQQIVKIMNGFAGIYTDDKMDYDFERTAEQRKKSKAIADWDFDKLKRYVEENKIVDRRNMPSMREAVEKLTADERMAAEQDNAYQRGLREGEMRARLGAMPRPASASAAMGPGQGPAPATLDEALSPENIQNDDELMKMLADMSNYGADLITGSK